MISSSTSAAPSTARRIDPALARSLRDWTSSEKPYTGSLQCWWPPCQARHATKRWPMRNPSRHNLRRLQSLSTCRGMKSSTTHPDATMWSERSSKRSSLAWKTSQAAWGLTVWSWTTTALRVQTPTKGNWKPPRPSSHRWQCSAVQGTLRIGGNIPGRPTSRVTMDVSTPMCMTSNTESHKILASRTRPMSIREFIWCAKSVQAPGWRIFAEVCTALWIPRVVMTKR